MHLSIAVDLLSLPTRMAETDGTRLELGQHLRDAAHRGDYELGVV